MNPSCSLLAALLAALLPARPAKGCPCRQCPSLCCSLPASEGRLKSSKPHSWHWATISGGSWLLLMSPKMNTNPPKTKIIFLLSSGFCLWSICFVRRGGKGTAGLRLVLHYSHTVSPGGAFRPNPGNAALITLISFGKITPFIWQYFQEYWTIWTSLSKQRTAPPIPQRLQMRRMAFHTLSTHKQTTTNCSPVLLSHCLQKKRATTQKAPRCR